MTDSQITLVGAGRMGSALAGGWLKAGLQGKIDIIDPAPALIVQAWASDGSVRLNPDLEPAEIRRMLSWPGQLDIVDCLAKLAQERHADFVILVFVVVKRFVRVRIHRRRENELDAILEIDDERGIRQESVCVPHFVEDANIVA